MHGSRHERAMTGSTAFAITVRDKNTTIKRSDTQYQLANHLGIITKHRGHQTAPASFYQVNCLLQIIIGHDRSDRTKSLDIVDFVGLNGILAIEQHSVEKCTRNTCITSVSLRTEEHTTELQSRGN